MSIMIITFPMKPPLFCNFHEVLGILRTNIFSMKINLANTEIVPLSIMVMTPTVHSVKNKGKKEKKRHKHIQKGI